MKKPLSETEEDALSKIDRHMKLLRKVERYADELDARQLRDLRWALGVHKGFFARSIPRKGDKPKQTPGAPRKYSDLKIGMTRQNLAQVEEREKKGNVTIKVLGRVAEVMGFRLVYFYVPISGKAKPLKRLYQKQILADKKAKEEERIQHLKDQEEVDRENEAKSKLPPKSKWQAPPKEKLSPPVRKF